MPKHSLHTLQQHVSPVKESMLNYPVSSPHVYYEAKTNTEEPVKEFIKKSKAFNLLSCFLFTVIKRGDDK